MLTADSGTQRKNAVLVLWGLERGVGERDLPGFRRVPTYTFEQLHAPDRPHVLRGLESGVDGVPNRANLHFRAISRTGPPSNLVGFGKAP